MWISNVGATNRTSSSRLTPPDASVPANPDLSGEMLNLVDQVAPVQKNRLVDRMLKQQYFKQYFAQAYRAAPIVRIDMIKHGVPATLVVELAAQLCISKEQLCRTLGLARATIDRKVREASLLSPDETSRVLGLSRLVGRVQAIMDDAGSVADFDAAVWAATWLEQPLPALGGQRPAEWMDTAEGQNIVFHLLDQIGSGAYA